MSWSVLFFEELNLLRCPFHSAQNFLFKFLSKASWIRLAFCLRNMLCLCKENMLFNVEKELLHIAVQASNISMCLNTVRTMGMASKMPEWLEFIQTHCLAVLTHICCQTTFLQIQHQIFNLQGNQKHFE